MKRKPIQVSHVFAYLFVVLVLLVFIVPLSYAVITAFKTPSAFLKDPLTFAFQPTFENFVNAWEKASLDSYLLNSVLYTFASTMISLFCSLLIAFPIARKYIKFSRALYLFLMVGMFLPDGSIPLFQIFLHLGMYNTRIAYILSMLTIGGVPMMFFTSFIQGIPKELDEAGIVDGCGYFRYFFRVIVPLAKPAISSMAVLLAIGIWNDITKAIIYLSDERLFPITKGLFAFSGQYSTQWTELMAALVIVSLPLIILYMFLQRFIIDGLTSGAVKM